MKPISMTILLIAIGLLISCASEPPKKVLLPAPQNAHKDLNQAQMELGTGNETKAVNRLRKLIQQHPKTDVADDAALALARVYFKKQSYLPAYQSYMSIIDSNTFSPNEAEALLGASRSLSKLGRMDEALSLSSRGLKIPGLSESLRVEFQRHRYSLLSSMGDRLDALRTLVDIAQRDNSTETQTTVQARANDYINRSLTLEELETVANNSEFGFIRPQAAFRLGVMKLAQKDYDGARRAFSRASELAPASPTDQQAQGYINQIDSRRKVEPYTIGAALPMSGRHAPIAQKTLRGLQLALGVYGESRSNFKLAVVDSEGTPEGGRRAVETLVTEDHAMAVVGSLLSREASAVAAKAEELGVPSIGLSQKAGLTSIGSTVFRNAVTSEMQVRHLVKLAIEELGYRRFAILYPNDPYGVEYANLFWDEVLARGGSITAAQTYDPSETDFRKPIKRLVGTYYLEDRLTEYKGRLADWYNKQKTIHGRTSPPDDLLPPIVDFDAIFVPDSPKAMGQIAPMLAYQGVNRVKLLGTNIWNSNEFLRRGQQNVQGALFVDAPLANDPNFKNSRFFNLFKRTFNQEPGLFEAQGYEVGLLLRELIERGERSRLGLVQSLGQVREFVGVSGPMSMSPQRELVRPLQVLAVKDGAIVAWNAEVEESLKKQIQEAASSRASARSGQTEANAKSPDKPKSPSLKK